MKKKRLIHPAKEVKMHEALFARVRALVADVRGLVGVAGVPSHCGRMILFWFSLRNQLQHAAFTA